jgi:hypothetical protein
MVNGKWYLVNGTWYLVNGKWYMVLGKWYFVLGTWYLVLGTWSSRILLIVYILFIVYIPRKLELSFYCISLRLYSAPKMHKKTQNCK